jgi:predicted dinucleotide-utilizing enzyme
VGAGGARRGLADAVKRIGLIGYGFIGRGVHQRLRERAELGIEVGFVHNRGHDRLAGLPPELLLDDLAALGSRPVDLVVEAAHPDYTRDWGERILAVADYLPVSVAALADDALRERLLAVARAHGTRLCLPHGALMGLDSLLEQGWAEVTITFRKAPENIDFAASGLTPPSCETVLYDGPARGIAAQFPRNINTMITCALATVGLDACRARLVAVPGLAVAVAEVEARAADGALLVMRKEQPAVGVSGSEMFASLFGSILRALAARETVAFV